MKVQILPWLVWLNGLSTRLQTERLLVQFPVKAHAWVADQVPSCRRAEATDQCMSGHIDVCLTH